MNLPPKTIPNLSLLKLANFSPSQRLQDFFLDWKLVSFRPKIDFKIEYKNFTIKTAQSTKEVIEALKLRNEVFWLERLQKQQHCYKELDEYDLIADHIILIDKTEQKVIGCYRLICSMFSDNFYCSSQYDLQKLIQTPGIKLELGRACTHPKYRNGASISLIWKGIAEYAKAVKADYFFGCTSIDSTNSQIAKNLWYHFQEHSLWSNDYQISALQKFKINTISKTFPLEENEKNTLIPTLLKSYLKAGAKIYGEPAIDRKMKTIDFITILKLSEISPRHFQRYFA